MESVLKKLCLCLAVLVVARAPAQHDWIGANASTWNNPGSALISTMVWNEQWSQITKQELKSGKLKAHSGVTQTTYQPSSSTTPELLAKALGNKPELKKRLLKFFKESLDYWKTYSRHMNREGDLGLAFAFFTGASIGLNRDQDVGEKQIGHLAGQFDALLAKIPKLQAAGDAAKQRIAETLACITVFELAGYQEGTKQNKPEVVDQFRQFAGKCVKSLLGLPIESLKLDDEGVLSVERE